MNWGARQFCMGVATAALLSSATHAFAGPQLKSCTNDENSADMRIESCTAVIDSQPSKPKTDKKKHKGDADQEISSKDKAAAYFSRGLARSEERRVGKEC